MKRGLVLGKFMPLHLGHVALINFAAGHCDELIVLVCASKNEPIAANIRLKWVVSEFSGDPKVKPILLEYNEDELPNTSVSSESVSAAWADYIKKHFEKIDIIFSSEAYGEYMAGFLECDYRIYDQSREHMPVSATQIRNDPFKYWDFIPSVVRPFFVKRICLYGSESTGKTMLTEKLATYYHTAYVPEMARQILENTLDCTEEHLTKIAELHALEIKRKLPESKKLLFVDTDVNITRSYSRFLFNKELIVPQWIDDLNNFDLYLYLDIDAPFVQDGTRLNAEERVRLNHSHKAELDKRQIKYHLVRGNWDERFKSAVEIIDNFM